MQNTIYEYIAPELWTLMDLGVHFGPGLFIVCGACCRLWLWSVMDNEII